jgi:hypothetical protein
MGIQGADDAYGALPQLDSIRQQMGAGAQIQALDGCGHATRPQQTLELMAAFVESIKAQRRGA